MILRQPILNRVFLGFSFLLVFSQSAVFGQQNQPPEITPIEPEKSVRRDLDGNTEHYYSIRLNAGETLDVEVEQIGINIAITFFDSAEKEIVELNTRSRTTETEAVILVAENPGTYLMAIHPNSKRAAPGAYRLKVSRPRPTTDADKKRFAAYLLDTEAQRLFLKEATEARRQSIAKSLEALELWKTLGDARHEAKTRYAVGWTHYWLSDYAPALEYLTAALELQRKIKDRAGEATTLRALGSLYIYNGANRPDLVESYLNQANQIHEELNDKYGAAITVYELASFQFNYNDIEKASANFKQALQLYRDASEERGEANSLTNLGTIYLMTGEFQNALDSFQTALELHKKQKDRIGEAGDLSKIGQSYLKLNELSPALDYLERALKIYDEVGYNYGRAYLYNNLATAQFRLGEHEKSLTSLEKALEFHRLSKNVFGEAYALGNIGRFYLERGDRAKASEFLNRGLELARSINDSYTEASILHALGDLLAKSERQKALEYFNQSLAIRRKTSDIGSEAVTLYSLANLEQENGNLKAAFENVTKAIEQIESLRSSVVNPQLRSTFLASQQDFYGLQIHLLMEMHHKEPAAGFDKKAVEAAERARARSLFELLSETKVDLRRGVKPELLAAERALQQKINYAESLRIDVLSRKHQPAEAQAAEKEIDRLLAEYARIQDRIRVENPEYAALKQPAPLRFDEIQAQLDGETVLLVYRLRDQQSYLWAVTPNSVKSVRLPGRETIEKDARSFYELLKNSYSFTARGQIHAASAALGKTLLAPVAGEIAGKRIVVVADGALNYIPFAALKISGEQPDAAFLIETNEIVSLPSVSVLAELRRRSKNRVPAAKTLAVFADPVFEASDERFKMTAANVQKTLPPESSDDASAIVTRAVENAGIIKLKRLRFSRREAEQIARLMPQSQLTALDFAASRENLLKTDLSRFRILHFATHGINNPRPELSGIVLSLFDEKGAKREGFLRSNEIYNLRLNADLVVLSACSTALGREIGGEGLINLTRGFFYAGSPRVVVSNWNVEDQSTAELMQRFYRAMFERKLGAPAALRQAQIEMLRETDWKAPYFWSAFVLQGDWR